MIRGRTLLVAAVLAGLTLSGCGRTADDQAGPFAPIFESLPPVSASPSMSKRVILAPEEPARTVLPGGEDVPDDEPPPTSDPPGVAGAGRAVTRSPSPAPPRRSRDVHRSPKRRDRPSPSATTATHVPAVKPKKTQAPAPVTSPPPTAPAPAPTTAAVPERACAAAQCR